MSRRFAGVGVGIPPERLQEIASGAPVDADEWADVIFGLTACETKRAERQAKFARLRRRGTQWLIVAGMVLIGMCVLVSIACLVFALAQHWSPY